LSRRRLSVARGDLGADAFDVFIELFVSSRFCVS
jgi:hypothetical protein